MIGTLALVVDAAGLTGSVKQEQIWQMNIVTTPKLTPLHSLYVE